MDENNNSINVPINNNKQKVKKGLCGFFDSWFLPLLIIIMAIIGIVFFVRHVRRVNGVKEAVRKYVENYKREQDKNTEDENGKIAKDEKKENLEKPQFKEVKSLTPSKRLNNVASIVKKKKFVSKGEQSCRDILEKRYSKPFPNIKPKWIINPLTGKNLELDCYCSDLKLAIEYSGKQHFQICAFAPTQKHVDYQRYKDRIKVERCKQEKVTLIVVPYTVKGHAKIEEYLQRKLVLYDDMIKKSEL